MRRSGSTSCPFSRYLYSIPTIEELAQVLRGIPERDRLALSRVHRSRHHFVRVQEEMHHAHPETPIVAVEPYHNLT